MIVRLLRTSACHITRGWPRLGEAIVRHRGHFCYVSAFLPGHREPTESELPASFGPKTGTPEERVDDTFIPCAGPKTGR